MGFRWWWWAGSLDRPPVLTARRETPRSWRPGGFMVRGGLPAEVVDGFVGDELGGHLGEPRHPEHGVPHVLTGPDPLELTGVDAGGHVLQVAGADDAVRAGSGGYLVDAQNAGRRGHRVSPETWSAGT